MQLWKMGGLHSLISDSQEPGTAGNRFLIYTKNFNWKYTKISKMKKNIKDVSVGHLRSSSHWDAEVGELVSRGTERPL